MRFSPSRCLAGFLLTVVVTFLTISLGFQGSRSGSSTSWFSSSPHTPGAENTLLMIKTGAKVLSRRLPVHLTLLDVADIPNYVLYSDLPDTLKGHTVIDILADVSTTVSGDKQFKPWHVQRNLRQDDLSISNAQIDGLWNLDKFKFLPMFAHAYRTFPDVKWYMFLEDDSFVFWNGLHRWLSTMNHSAPLYIGSPNALPDPKLKGPEAIAKGITFAHGGSGVLVSQAAMRETFGKWNALEHGYDVRALEICCGDVLLGEVLKEAGIPLALQDVGGRVRFQGEGPSKIRYTPVNWCEPILSFHHVTPMEIGQLYEYERQWRGTDPIRYRDIYKEYVGPYLETARMSNWDNLAEDNNVTIDAANWDPASACEAKCTEWMYCLQWKLEGTQCYLGGVARLGNEKSDTVSGWLRDRIKNQLQDINCDEVKLN